MKAKRVSKAKRLSVDRITTLPQTIIETILCLLPTEEAARTSILSSEWRYKWTKIPKLAFLESTLKSPCDEKPLYLSNWKGIYDREMVRRIKDVACKLFYAIHQVLLLRQGPIQEFSLSMTACVTFFEIDQIILHLSRNHTLKKLTLNFVCDDYYELPSSLFTLHHLTDLYLAYCDFNLTRNFNGFRSLTSLTLSRVSISREILLHLLSNCPSLKSLSLFLRIENFNGSAIRIMKLFKCLPVIEHLTTWGLIFQFVDVTWDPEELPTSLNHLKYFCMEHVFW